MGYPGTQYSIAKDAADDKEVRHNIYCALSRHQRNTLWPTIHREDLGGQTACKPGSVLAGKRGMAIPLGRSLPNASRDRPGRRRRNTVAGFPACHPYLVLLPVAFAVPLPLPVARWALTPPFHPYRPGEPGRRSILCGTFPGVAPAGRYPAPCLRGARTFLTGRLPVQRSHPAV